MYVRIHVFMYECMKVGMSQKGITHLSGDSVCMVIAVLRNAHIFAIHFESRKLVVERISRRIRRYSACTKTFIYEVSTMYG